MPRILIIDDERDVVRLVIRALAPRGHLTLVARNIARAKEVMAREHVHLILLDDDLSDDPGLVMCEQLRTVKRIPIILVTHQIIELEDVMHAQAPDGFLQRPFGSDSLVRLVEYHLYGRNVHA